MKQIKIISINIGMPQTMSFGKKEIQSGIQKKPITTEKVFLTRVGFEGDGQADLVHHGGPDKAVCVYPYEHYEYWSEYLQEKLQLGAFGENLTLFGVAEKDVCIGDIFQLGEAVVQISQPRQPCYKLSARYNNKSLPLAFEETGFTGYYFRVLEEGYVSSSSTITRLHSDSKQISVAYANQIRHIEKENTEGIKNILAVEALSSNWKEAFEKRLAGMTGDETLRREGESGHKS